MPEPNTHVAAAIALSGASVGTASALLGVDTGALFWSFLGAVCWQAAQPQLSSVKEIRRSAAFAIISTVLGTLGSVIAAAAALHYFKYLQVVDPRMLVGFPAFFCGLFGHVLVLKGEQLIKDYRRGGA